MLSDFHIKSKLPLRRLHRVSAQCWRGRRRNVFLENFYAFRMKYFQIKVNNSGRCHNVRRRILEVIFRDNRLFFMLFAYFVYIAHLTKIHTWKLFAHGKIFETRNFPYTHTHTHTHTHPQKKQKIEKDVVKFPHSPILHYAFSSLIEKTMTKTIHCHRENRFVLQ